MGALLLMSEVPLHLRIGRQLSDGLGQLSDGLGHTMLRAWIISRGVAIDVATSGHCWLRFEC
jgi:hypothetical protein